MKKACRREPFFLALHPRALRRPVPEFPSIEPRKQCPQCNHWQGLETIACPCCRYAFRSIANDEREGYPFPDFEPRWATAIGAWGDVICCLGNIYRVLRHTGQPSINVLYYGRDPKIANFLSGQRGIRRVLFRHASSQGELQSQFAEALASHPASVVNDLKVIFAGTGIEGHDVWPTHVTAHCLDGGRCERWHGARLHQAARVWARRQMRGWRGRGRVYAIQPCSLQSGDWQVHWRYWEAGIRYLLQETPHRYVLLGLERRLRIEHPRLRDLVGKSPDMQAVFAIAGLCDGVITTSNSLALFATVNQIPALIMAKQGDDSPNSYYHRWMAAPPSALYPSTTNFERFKTIANEWFN